MRSALRIAAFLLLLPAAEFLVFLLVAWAIGFWTALGLMLLTSLAGVFVLRRINRGGFTAFRRLGAALGRAIRRKPQTTGPGAVIDLAPTEWKALPDRKPRRSRSG